MDRAPQRGPALIADCFFRSTGNKSDYFGLFCFLDMRRQWPSTAIFSAPQRWINRKIHKGLINYIKNRWLLADELKPCMELREYNYKAPEFLKKLRALFRRDAALLNGAYQRTVILKRKGQPYQHAITRVDIFGSEGGERRESSRNYGTIRFIAEEVSLGKMLSRLQRLQKMRFTANRIAVTFPNAPGFHNRYCARNSEFSQWPGTLFEIGLETVYLSGDTLIHRDPELPTYETEFDAVGEFLGFPNFCSHDGRTGHILLFVPNFNGRIERLSLTENGLAIELRTAVPLGDLTLEVEYSNAAERRKHSITPGSQTEILPVDFSPTTLSIWLKSRRGYVLDYHKEDLYGSAGAAAILPKSQSPTSIANIPLAAMGTGFSQFDSVDIFTPPEEEILRPSTPQHTFLPAGSQHDAYVEIRKIIQQATVELLIVDPWVDDSLWVLLSNVPPNCRIRVLTQEMKKDFQLEAKKFAAQHKKCNIDPANEELPRQVHHRGWKPLFSPGCLNQRCRE